MEAKGLTPILNVSDIVGTFAWFEKWGWKKLWDWGTPPTFGAVGSGKEVCIFLCQGAQGGRGRGANTTTFQQEGDEEGDKGVWMSVWVDDVDEMHKRCVAAGLEVTFPPTDMPWNVREMHLRHPDMCFGSGGDSRTKSRTGSTVGYPPSKFPHPQCASGDSLNPLASPGRGLEGVREVLGLVHDLAVAELHNAHCVCRPPLVGDCVFRDPEIPVSEHSPDVEA